MRDIETGTITHRIIMEQDSKTLSKEIQVYYYYLDEPTRILKDEQSKTTIDLT